MPNLGTGIPEVPITFRSVAVAIVSLITAGILVNFGREIEPRLERVLSGPDEIIADTAEIVKLLAFLAAILVVYGRFGGVVVPFLGDVWIYNVVFLVIALVPTAIVALRISNNVEAITDIITEQVKAATVDETTRPSCSESVRASLEFCPECGDELPDDEQPGGESTVTCSDCGSDVRSGAAFCGSCGSEVASAD